jgi:hypothetical protein
MSFTHFAATKLTNYDSERSFAFKLRKKRAERIKTLIAECWEVYKEVNIIDIGGTKTYWKIIPSEFLESHQVHITIVNVPSWGLPLGHDGLFTVANGDGCDLASFADRSFHLAHSNSVIEHVGHWQKKVRFAQELKRVGERYYLQTPNFWFPFEPHFFTPFFHWLPKPIRIGLHRHLNLGWYGKAKSYSEARQNIDTCTLLSKKDLMKLLPGGQIYGERFGPWVKSFVVVGSHGLQTGGRQH